MQLVESANVGNAETSQNTPQQAVQIPSPAPAADQAAPGVSVGAATGDNQPEVTATDQTPPQAAPPSEPAPPEGAPQREAQPVAYAPAPGPAVPQQQAVGYAVPASPPAQPAGYTATAHASAQPGHAYTSAQQPLMAATRPAVAGLKTVPDLRLRRLMGVSAWALFLGSAGLVLGAIALFRMMGEMPGWFEPVFSATGVFGLILIIAAFVTVRYRLVPWMLLSASSITFAVGIVLLGTA